MILLIILVPISHCYYPLNKRIFFQLNFCVCRLIIDACYKPYLLALYSLQRCLQPLNFTVILVFFFLSLYSTFLAFYTLKKLIYTFQYVDLALYCRTKHIIMAPDTGSNFCDITSEVHIYS
jgi:hypothetical protein